MRHGMPFQLELAGESATLYVHDPLDAGSSSAMLAACAALPRNVRTLRLDLRAMRVMTAEATNAVRQLLAQWRDAGRGEFRLSTSHLMAVCVAVADAPPVERMPSRERPSEYGRHPMALAPL
jgi:hypothetical protein